jgi:hypothetical protein
VVGIAAALVNALKTSEPDFFHQVRWLSFLV